MEDTVTLALVLTHEARSPEGVEALRRELRVLQLEPTGSGLATLSARLSPETFRRLFEAELIPVEASPPGDAHMGAPGGYRCDEELAVPEILRPFVASITVVPPALRLGKD